MIEKVDPRPARRLLAADATAAAGLHAATMDEAWNAAAWQTFLVDPATIALGTSDSLGLAALLLIRTAADEAEVLTIAVASRARRRGIASGLLCEGLLEAARRGAGTVFLEVAADNVAALALYRRAGFVEIGGRSGYYRRQSGSSRAVFVDALTMSCQVQDA